MYLFTALHIFLVFASCSLASGKAPRHPKSNESHPFCIIGAGPSGLTVARQLEARGASTVIFDSNVEVGGKCQSYYDDPIAKTTYHAMAALIFTNASYPQTLQLIEESGLPLSPALSPGPSANWQYWQYSPGVTNVTKTALPDAATDLLIGEEVVKYTEFWNTTFKPNYTTPRYNKSTVPPELAVPMVQWLSDNNFTLLPTFIEEGLVYEGYGNITQTPALYALQFLTPDILTYYIGTTPGYFVDFHKLWVWYSQTHVKGRIHSSTNVTKIDRSGTYPILSYQSVNGTSTQSCSNLVLAFPPTPRALQAAGLDLTAYEEELFSNVGVTAYWSAQFNMSGLPYPYAFLESPAASDFGPIAMLRYFGDSPIATAYSLGPSPYDPASADTDAQVQQLLVQTANSLGQGLAKNKVDGITTPITVTNEDVKVLARQDHFPHVLTDALEGGFYEKYNALQGKKNTYWTSGLNSFENVENAIKAAEDLVKNVIF